MTMVVVGLHEQDKAGRQAGTNQDTDGAPHVGMGVIM